MFCLFFFFSEGSNLTPAHHFPDFRFKTYAPVAFRYFRELFGIRPDDYLVRQSLVLLYTYNFHHRSMQIHTHLVGGLQGFQVRVMGVKLFSTAIG